MKLNKKQEIKKFVKTGMTYRVSVGFSDRKMANQTKKLLELIFPNRKALITSIQHGDFK